MYSTEELQYLANENKGSIRGLILRVIHLRGTEYRLSTIDMTRGLSPIIWQLRYFAVVHDSDLEEIKRPWQNRFNRVLKEESGDWETWM